MQSDRGIALILTLIFLSFLAVLGAALLTTATIEVWTGDNYGTNAQSLYVAEAGLEQAREAILSSTLTPGELLSAASGDDGSILASLDLGTLLASDDRPLFPRSADNAAQAAGEFLYDASGREIGRYWVWLRNDPAEGSAVKADSNEVLTLLSVAQVRNARKTIEMTVRKSRFPSLPAALTLDGAIGVFEPPDSGVFQIDGTDGAATPYRNGIGVIDAASEEAIRNGIPEGLEENYTGSGSSRPDAANIEAELDERLKTPAGLERIVSGIAANADHSYSGGYGWSQEIGSVGSPVDYRIVVVHGDCVLGPGTGYGMLLVRGNLTISGSFQWFGPILVVGQGVLRWNSSASGAVHGGMFLARTRGLPGPENPLGSVLDTRGSVSVSLRGAGGPGIQYNSAHISASSRSLPFTPISVREY
jgi:hypothetical protein